MALLIVTCHIFVIIKVSELQQSSLEEKVKQLRSEVRQITEISEEYLKYRLKDAEKGIESQMELLRNNFVL